MQRIFFFLVIASILLIDTMPVQGSSVIVNKMQIVRDGADYLIITNHLFASHLEPLIKLREKCNLSVKVVQDTAIYRLYPAKDSVSAIKEYILNAYKNWSPRPSYILLVGDANEKGGSNNYIPSKIFPKFNYSYLDPNIKTHCSDNWYAELEGTDYVPELIIGRFPVESTDELDLLIQKTVEYESQSMKIDTVMVVMAGEYVSSCASVYNALPASCNPVKLYGNALSASQCNSVIKSTYASGLDLVFGICHGGLSDVWTGQFTSGSTVFSAGDFSSIPSKGNAPILFEWG